MIYYAVVELKLLPNPNFNIQDDKNANPNIKVIVDICFITEDEDEARKCANICNQVSKGERIFGVEKGAAIL
jgi:hypothetical protein